MSEDEINDALQRIFPGDIIAMDDCDVLPVRVPRRRVEPTVNPFTRMKFEKLMTAPVSSDPPVDERRVPPHTPHTTPPTMSRRSYLLESTTNAESWLHEARDIESDLKLGQPVEPHLVTRLMLDAIPVVEQFTKRED